MAGGGGDLKIRGLIEWLFKGKGLKDSKKGLDEVGTASDKTEKKTKKLGATGESVGKKLTQYLGAAVLMRIAQASLSAFATYERGLNAVGRALSRMGIDSDKAMPRIASFLEELEEMSGTLRQDLLPVMQKFVGIMGSVEGGMYATALAADLTAAGLGDIKTNGERLANLLQGEVTEASKSLGLKLRDNNGAIKTQSELLLELEQIYGGTAAAMDDSQSQLESAGAAWNEFKMSLGEGIGILFKLVGGFNNVIKGVKTVGLAFSQWGTTLIAQFMEIGGVLKRVFDFKKLLTSPREWWLDVKEQATRGLENLIFLEEGFAEEYKAIWAEAGEQAGVDMEKGREEALKVARAKEEEASRKEAARLAKLAAQAAEKKADFEARAEQQLLRARIATAKEGSQARLDLEMKALAQQEKMAIDAANKIGADTAAIEEAFSLARDARQEEHDTALRDERMEAEKARRDFELEAEIGLIDAKAAAFEEADEEHFELMIEKLEREYEEKIKQAIKLNADLTKIEKKFLADIDALKAKYQKADEDRDKQEAEDRAELNETIANEGIALMGMTFGKNKGIAIAQAIINTYVGASKALAQGGIYGGILAAIVIAMGMVQVQKIRQAQPAGFDDPENDRSALLGGRRWANDMVRNISLGFSQGLETAIPSLQRGSVADGGEAAGAPTPVNIGNIVGADSATMRRLYRVIRRAQDRDRGRLMT